MPQRRWLWLAAPAVLLGVAGLMSRTVDDLGITWDEPVYRYTQTQMAEWFGQLGRCRSLADVHELLDARVLHEHWIGGRYGKNFHPPMAALLNNVSYGVFGRWLGDMAARRMASALELAAAAVMLFVFLGRRYGCASGAVAAGSLCLIPRVFGHANLAATDVPMMFCWVAIALVFWKGMEGASGRVGEWASGPEEGPRGRGVEGSRGWCVAFGVMLGIGFLVKLPTVLVLLPILAYMVLVRGRGGEGAGWWRRNAGWVAATAVPLAVVGVEVWRQAGMMWEVAVERVPQGLVLGGRWYYLAEEYLLDPQYRSGVPAWLVFVPLAVWWVRWLWMRRGARADGSPVGEVLLAALAWAPAVAVALHPGWWHNTLVRLGHYWLLCTQRSGALPEIEIFYLGRKYVYSLPWHNGFALLGVTVPLGILALGVCGTVVACLRVRRDRLPMFLLLNLLALPVVRMFGTPGHDGVRLMLPAFFFLAALGGIGFGAVGEWASGRVGERVRRLLCGGVAAVALLPALVGLVRSHPYELSYYNPGVAGLPGASRVGFEVSYWYDALNAGAVRHWRAQLPDDAVPVLPAAAPDQPSSAAAAVWMSLTGEADPKEQPDREGTRFLLLLTHSSKSQPVDRLVFAMRPTLVLAEHRGVRLMSVYDERAMARAQALVLLSAAAGSLERSASLRGQLEEMRRAQPQAVAEAEEIVARRRADVARVVRYEGYLPDTVRGAYLDEE